MLPENLERIVGRILEVISSPGFPPGYRGALRRMHPGHAPPLAFYQFATCHLPEGWENDVLNWMTLLAGMARSPQSHIPTRHLGQGLADAQFSEARLERLLASEGETLRSLFLDAVRFLSAQGISFDWREAAALLFARSDEAKERIRRRIATDFYRNLKES